MTCPKCFEGTYSDGFEDAKLKAIDVINKYLHGPYDKVDLYQVKKDLEKI